MRPQHTQSGPKAYCDLRGRGISLTRRRRWWPTRCICSQLTLARWSSRCSIRFWPEN